MIPPAPSIHPTLSPTLKHVHGAISVPVGPGTGPPESATRLNLAAINPNHDIEDESRIKRVLGFEAYPEP